MLELMVSLWANANPFLGHLDSVLTNAPNSWVMETIIAGQFGSTRSMPSSMVASVNYEIKGWIVYVKMMLVATRSYRICIFL